RGRPDPRRLVVLRGQHARADRDALLRRVVRRQRQADAVDGDAGPPLRAPRAREGAQYAALADPRDRDAEWRRIWREERSVRTRVLGRAPIDAHEATREVHPRPRGGLLRPPRPPSREDAP